MWDLLGLDEADESVYRHDVCRPGSTVRQAARSVGLPEEVVRTCRHRLVACGLLREEGAGGFVPTPTGPAMIAEQLRDELDNEYAHRRREVSRLQTEMTRLVNDHLFTAPSGAQPQVDRLPNSDAAAARINELLCVARAEVARAEPGSEPNGHWHGDPIMPAEIKAAERGVNVRTIYPPNRLASPVTRRVVKHQLRAGISVRTAATPATNLTIVDSCIAVVVDHRGDSVEYTVLLRDSLLVHTLNQLFETTWTHARDATRLLSEGPDRVGDVNVDERLLLQLLGEGLKDESVAKHLGISVRTVRRKIGDLLNRLRATSRFQAGMLATRRDWV
jgi:DNA-binding CsgD family transcriptional regulator